MGKLGGDITFSPAPCLCGELGRACPRRFKQNGPGKTVRHVDHPCCCVAAVQKAESRAESLVALARFGPFRGSDLEDSIEVEELTMCRPLDQLIPFSQKVVLKVHFFLKLEGIPKGTSSFVLVHVPLDRSSSPSDSRYRSLHRCPEKSCRH